MRRTKVFPDGVPAYENHYYWEDDDSCGIPERERTLYIDSMLLIDPENTTDYKKPVLYGQAIDVISFFQNNYYIYLLKDSMTTRTDKDVLKTRINLWDIKKSLENEIQKKYPDFYVKCGGYTKYRGAIRSEKNHELNGEFYKKGDLYFGGETNIISRIFWYSLETGQKPGIICCGELKRLNLISIEEIEHLYNGASNYWPDFFFSSLDELENLASLMDKNYFNNITPNRTVPKKNYSNGELEILRILKNLRLFFQCQYRPKELDRNYKYDFYVEDSNGNYGLIEYDGPQHFKAVEYFGGQKSFEYTRERDLFKNDFCLKNEIPFLRIRDDQFGKISEMVEKFIGNLGNYSENFNPYFSNKEYYLYNGNNQNFEKPEEPDEDFENQ